METETIVSIKNNIKTLSNFMNEALQNGNMTGYAEALKNMQVSVDMLCKCEAEKTKEPEIPTYQTVFSSRIAESLIVDFGYFESLVKIEPNKRFPTKKSYVFKNSPELKVEVDKLIANAKELKEQRLIENQEIDTAIKAIATEVTE